jgi:peptidoglycan/LPS O-acetylase OafA/YrhL
LKLESSVGDSLDILNSLRAVAAVMVCLFHSGFLLTPFFPAASQVLDIGQEGVYVFFVISGMVMPLSMDKIAYRVSDFFAFMAKRILRLQPPMMLSAIVVAITSWAMLNTDGHNGWQLLAASATLTAPLFDLPWVNGIYWTLFVEMQYYIYIALAFPLLTLPQVLKRSTTVVAILAISFISISMEGNDAKSNLPFHLPVFLMGYYLFMRYKQRIGKLEFYLGISACIAVCFYLTVIAHGLGFRIVTTATFTTLIIANIRNGWRWLSALGEYSYSLYLMHWPVISMLCFILGGVLKTPWGNASVFVCIQIAAIPIAWGFYQIAEKPALKLAKRVKYQR